MIRADIVSDRYQPALKAAISVSYQNSKSCIGTQLFMAQLKQLPDRKYSLDLTFTAPHFPIGLQLNVIL